MKGCISREDMPGRAVRAVLVLGVLLGGVAVVEILDRVFPPPLEDVPPISTVVSDNQGRALRAFPVEDGRWRLAADLDRIDPDFLTALIRIEDKRFYDHGGVDPLAVLRATGSLVRERRIVSGASTLTMQTARLLEPRPRTLPSKLIEMMRAWQIERRLTKDEILELYLTLTPYGGNLEGVRAASWAYFDREPDELSADQIALLIALPQAPEARRPDLRPEASHAAREVILNRMAGYGILESSRVADLASLPMPDRAAFPGEAWHASEEVRQHSDAADIHSTLNGPLQTALEDLVTLSVSGLDEAVQMSILVVEGEGRAVRALIGSADRARPGGWIDLTDRPRSPGSTLKPLIYALAFEDGIAAPDTRIEDLPRRFANYQPENFDRTFRGEVTMTEALQHSLNVPAVHILDALGANRFAATLQFAGSNPRLPDSPEKDAGLALALGGLGMTSRELAVLYAALNDNGLALPLAWTQTGAEANRIRDPHRVVSAETAEEVLDILRRAPAPEGRMPSMLAEDAPAIAFKTGTSYGFRDAWAAGVSGDYTVIVWMGRADGVPRPGETGRKAALPVLFEAFDLIARHDRDFQPDRSDRNEPVETPVPLARFNAQNTPPEIIFPPDESEIWAGDQDRGFVLAARGEGPLAWYVDGEPVRRDVGGDPVWTPVMPGFYELSVVDAAGRASQTRVRVRSG